MITYTAPTPQDLQRLKTELDYTGKEMAALACVGEQHWRKYTGGADPREMPYPNLFHLAAALELSPEEMERVHNRMRAIGAQVLVE
ncbi:hypothetical protein L512_1734 [Bordetella bronchiseptica MBORD624]|uniref:XRE family transcriptional regulator n=1 Tax=Bordetella bronchiseptica TaxID=518 RepID=UPI000461DB0C|nr:hypothetical protein L511_4122 [Bordetella bronchiseptica MBORD595]KDC72469.1 hypothetical protein L512_1734 [Bordetella bronchiseptica MBORD624]